MWVGQAVTSYEDSDRKQNINEHWPFAKIKDKGDGRLFCKQRTGANWSVS